MILGAHVTDLIPAYALDCLDDAEIDGVAAHLAVCEACRGELEEFQNLTNRLPLAAPQVEPPRSVKLKLMEKIQRPVREAASPLPWWQRLGEVFRRASPGWALASLVLVVGLVSSNLLLWNRINRLSQEVPAAMSVINLGHTDVAPGSTGLLVVSVDGQHGTLVVDHLPALGEEQQYQLWLIDNGSRTSGGVFSVSQDGYGALWVSSPKPLADYSGFGITIEPAGGSQGPTGEKVLGSDLRNN